MGSGAGDGPSATAMSGRAIGWIGRRIMEGGELEESRRAAGCGHATGGGDEAQAVSVGGSRRFGVLERCGEGVSRARIAPVFAALNQRHPVSPRRIGMLFRALHTIGPDVVTTLSGWPRASTISHVRGQAEQEYEKHGNDQLGSLVKRRTMSASKPVMIATAHWR